MIKSKHEPEFTFRLDFLAVIKRKVLIETANSFRRKFPGATSEGLFSQSHCICELHIYTRFEDSQTGKRQESSGQGSVEEPVTGPNKIKTGRESQLTAGGHNVRLQKSASDKN